MTKPHAALAAAAALILLPACGSREDDAPAAETATASSTQPVADPLVGRWTSDAPAEFVGEGLRTRMADGRTDYRPDGSFAYAGRLTVFGERLPSDGMSFAVTADGRWQRQGDRLTEDYTAVRVVPEHEDGELRRLADQLGREMVEEPATVSRVETLEGGRMTLSTEGRSQSYTRR